MAKTKKKGRRKRSFSNLNISLINQHKQNGSKLTPPLAQLSQMSMSSWADDHMPEMLWAVLLTGVLDRNAYLDCFRRVAILCREWFVVPEDASPAEREAAGTEEGVNFTVIVDHTKLAEVSDEQFRQVISIPLKHALGYAALRPLLLIESLPGLARWKAALDVEPVENDWDTLAKSVSGVLDHQSEASTDIRWFKLMLPIISGRMIFPESMTDRVEELRLFPDKGDMRSVRPFIRSGEMMLRRNPPLPWVGEFWTELLSKTGCLDPSSASEYSIYRSAISPKSLYSVRKNVIERFLGNLSAKRSDARLDSSFGLVFYALSIVAELGFHSIQAGIVGRLAIRSLVEANITLRYLVKKDKDELWKSFRVYGAGQAKLAFLKAHESEDELPKFIDEQALYEIANEDLWQEFLDIDIGHWANSNLRKLSMDSETKQLYDKYYDWTSTYAHSHWGAVRDTNFVTCHNPLHRLHRIPRLIHRSLNPVEGDAVNIVNEMLSALNLLYPGPNEFGELSLLVPGNVEPDGNAASENS